MKIVDNRDLPEVINGIVEYRYSEAFSPSKRMFLYASMKTETELKVEQWKSDHYGICCICRLSER